MIGNGLFRRVAAVVSTGALATGMSTGCGLRILADYGCSDRDVRFAGDLGKLPVLGDTPGDAEKIVEESGCDDDDGFAYAHRVYRTGLDRDGILAFYRTAAEKDGWQWDGRDDARQPSGGLVVSGAANCYTKQVDGTTAYLSVWFPSDFNGPDDRSGAHTGEYGLDVTASHDGSAWC